MMPSKLEDNRFPELMEALDVLYHDYPYSGFGHSVDYFNHYSEDVGFIDLVWVVLYDSEMAPKQDSYFISLNKDKFEYVRDRSKLLFRFMIDIFFDTDLLSFHVIADILHIPQSFFYQEYMKFASAFPDRNRMGLTSVKHKQGNFIKPKHLSISEFQEQPLCSVWSLQFIDEEEGHKKPRALVGIYGQTGSSQHKIIDGRITTR